MLTMSRFRQHLHIAFIYPVRASDKVDRDVLWLLLIVDVVCNMLELKQGCARPVSSLKRFCYKWD